LRECPALSTKHPPPIPTSPLWANGGGSCRHTRDFSKISANKINNLRKIDYYALKPSAEQKTFLRKNTTQQVPKNKHHCLLLLADPPEIDISKKSVKTPIKKKVFDGFSGNCLRMQKP
jgi:hypothetical protein